MASTYIHLSFNPYFTGCSTSTKKKTWVIDGREQFQSLFYWMFYFNKYCMNKEDGFMKVSILILLDVLLQLINGHTKLTSKDMFQSLFYWMFYFNQVDSILYEHNNGVSILILLDVLLQISHPIQSLLCLRVSILILLDVLLQLPSVY